MPGIRSVEAQLQDTASELESGRWASQGLDLGSLGNTCGLGSLGYSGWGVEGTFSSGRWELLGMPLDF